MHELNKSVNPPTVREVVNAVSVDRGDTTEDAFASVPLTRDQLKLKGIDFGVQLKERKMVRVASQREQVERISASPKADMDGLGVDGRTTMTGAQMRRMRKNASLPPEAST